MNVLKRFRKQSITSRTGRYVYPIGPGGIGRAIDLGSTRVKSTGSPLLDRLMGIGDDTDDLTQDDQGWARAYRSSATAFRCIEVRAQTLANIPLRVVDAHGNDVAHPLQEAIGPRKSYLRYVTESDKLVFGRAFWEYGIDRNRPDRAWVKRLNPSTIEIIADVNGINGFKQVIDGKTVAEWGPYGLVCHTTYDPLSDFGYISPMQRVLRSVGISINISVFGEYFFKNGAMPDGILVSEEILRDSDRDRMLAEWRRQFQGVENAHGTALLDGGRVTYQSLTPPLKDLAMPELREGESYIIAQGFGVPPTMAMITNAANFATADSERKSLYTETVLPSLDMMLDVVNTQLIPRFGVQNVTIEADTSEIEPLQEDRTEITQRAAQGVGAGYLSLNDARDLENQDKLKTDYFVFQGKLVPRAMLESGDFERLRDLGVLGQPEQLPQLGGFPFGSLPARSEPPVVLDNPPQKSIVDIRVHAPEEAWRGREVQQAVVSDTMIKDLERWRKKIANKGTDCDFDPDYLPVSIAAFLRAEVKAWDGDTERDQWIDAAFNRATKAVYALVKQDDATATPDEFEAFWRDIDGLFDDAGIVFEQQFDALRSRLVDALRSSGDTFDLAAFLTAQTPIMIEALAGTEDEPGVLVNIVQAGAARGNDIYRSSTKQADLTIDWELVNGFALDFAREFSGELITGINQTTLDIFRTKIAEWIAAGGTLEDLADYIEGILPEADIPPGWSPGKLNWATSRSRARLIAQTETTRAFTEGNFERWRQLGVDQVEWRTQRDSDVDDEICRPLHGVVGTIDGGFVHPQTGVTYRIPAHPGCRCFPRPRTGRV